MLLCTGAAAAVPGFLRAQTLPVALSPTRFEFAANAGDTLKGTIEFWNGTEGGLPVSIEGGEFIPQDEDGHVALVGGLAAQARSLKNWITAQYPLVTVVAKEKIRLDFTLRIPSDAEPGTYWGAIVARTLPRAGQGSVIETKIAAIILLRVYGEAQEQLVLESFAATGFAEHPPIMFTARFRNVGTVHVRPLGSIVIRNYRGKDVASVFLPEWNVLPGAIRKFEGESNEAFWPGRYSALLEATYGTNGDVLTAEAKFWIMPWRKMLTAFLMLGGAIGIGILTRRRFRAAWHVLRTGVPPSVEGVPGRRVGDPGTIR